MAECGGKESCHEKKLFRDYRISSRTAGNRLGDGGHHLKRNDNLYEILPPDVPVKLCFDLELEIEGITRGDGDRLAAKILSFFSYQQRYLSRTCHPKGQQCAGSTSGEDKIKI